MGAFSPLTVIDRYRVTSLKGGAVFVSNHSSALDAGVPIVPAYTDGPYEVFPRFRRIPRRHPASITFGDPLYPQPGEDYDSFIARTEQAVRTLAGPKGLLRDEPAPTGSGSAEGSNYWY